MRIKEYIAYFKDIAAAHKEVNHFTRIIAVDWPLRNLKLEEFLSSLRAKKVPFPMLIVETYIKRGKDWRGGQKDNKHEGAFLIIDSAGRGNFEDENDKLDKCEEISDDIIAYMVHELQEKWSTIGNRGKRYLEFNDLNTEFVGDFGDNLVGVRVNFSIQKNIGEPEYDASKFEFPQEQTP